MKTSRRWFLVALALVGLTTIVVVSIQHWKAILERIQFGESRHLLGTWDVVSCEPQEDDPPRRFRFSTELRGFLELRLQVSKDEGSPLNLRLEGDEVHYHDPEGEVGDGVFRFRLLRDRLVIEESSGIGVLVLRRTQRQEQ